MTSGRGSDPVQVHRGKPSPKPLERFLGLFQSPLVGASVITLSFFILILLGSNIVLADFSIKTLGLTTTVFTLTFLALLLILLMNL